MLSDLYAMGISRCDHMLMILGVCLGMTNEEQEISTREMIRGFNDKAMEAGTLITGGQSVFNEYPMIGGVANVVVGQDEFIVPKYGRPGDVLILTKALGSRVAINAYKWYKDKSPKWPKAKQYISESEVQLAYDICCEEMTTLNKKAAELMLKHGIHGATDITGFGLLGHANNLAEAQEQAVDLRIHTLPIINKMALLHDKVVNYKLLTGFAPETSGGIMMMVPPDKVDTIMREFKVATGKEAWIIGELVKGSKKAFIDKDYKIIEVA